LYTDITCTKIVLTPYPVTAAQWEEIRKELEEGRPVILQVDFIPATSNVDMHFVLLVGFEDGKWIVNDPWYGDQASLERYGKPELTVQQYVFHAGPVQVSPAVSPELQACLTTHKTLMEKIQKELEPKIADLNTRLQETSHELEGARSEITSFKRNQTQLASTLQVDDQPNAIIGAVVDLQKQIQGYKEFQGVLVEKLTCEDRPGAIIAEVEKWLAKEDAFIFAGKKIEEQKNEITRLNMKLEQAEITLQEQTTQNTTLSQSLTEVTEQKNKLESDLAVCQTSQRFKPLFTIFGLSICKEVMHA
jgi:predicted  nucleic acid-binding Zn-ribbon protein